MNLNLCPYIDKCKKFTEKNCPLCLGESDGFCMKLFKINQLQENALLSDKHRKHLDLRIDSTGEDLDAFNYLKNVEENIEEFILKGNNLYIWSSTFGNGKTSWSVRLLNSYIEKIWYKSDIRCRGLFINVPKFLLALKDNISEKNDYISHIKENVLIADVVIWDDIATKGFTEFEMENVLNIINNRLDLNKSNIYTSNLIGEDLKQSVGERLYSRIINNSLQVQFRGSDKRSLYER